MLLTAAANSDLIWCWAATKTRKPIGDRSKYIVKSKTKSKKSVANFSDNYLTMLLITFAANSDLIWWWSSNSPASLIHPIKLEVLSLIFYPLYSLYL